MLTRRQARLLGLTSGEEGGSASPASPQSPTGQGLDAAAAGVDLPTSSGTGPASSPHLVLQLGAATLSASTLRGSGGSVDHGNAFFAPSATALVLATLHAATVRSSSGASAANGSAGRGRLGARQVEAMRCGAQAVVDYWAASSTTAGPSIRLARPHDGAWPTSLSLSSESSAPACAAHGNGGAGVVSSGSVRPNNGSGGGRPARLSAAQLRLRWRAVTRNCSSLAVPAKLGGAAGGGGGGGGGSVSKASLHADRSANGNGSHTLVLPHAAATARPASPPPSEVSAWAADAHGAASSTRRNGVDGTVNGVHDDRTHAGPEVASRRSLTYFTVPFCTDAPLPVPAAVSSPSAASSASGETRAAASPAALARRTPLTALALRQQKEAARTQRQRRLSHEVYYQVYVKAHEARMRLLFGLGDGGEMRTHDGSGSGGSSGSAAPPGMDRGEDATVAGEAAYLQTLNASTEEEGRVLRVIASIDAALHRQLAAAYRPPAAQPPGSSHAATPTSAAASTSSVRAPTQRARAAPFAARRPAILEAAIADATDGVAAFTHRLLPYQQEGVRWLLRLNVLEHMNGILADDMGLGKTAQTVVYLACFKDLVERVVQRPLDVLRHRHARLCQRALGLTASAAGGVGVEEAALLPPWLMWCEGGLAATNAGSDGDDDDDDDDEVKHDGRGAASRAASPELRAARACGNSIRLVKQVKHWLWQVDGDKVAAATAAPPRTARQPAPPHLAGRKRGAASDGENEAEDADADEAADDTEEGTAVPPNLSAAAAVVSTHATAPALAVEGHAGGGPVAVVAVRRRRGRPPKQLSAMLAAAAATATPVEVGSAGLAQLSTTHTTVAAFAADVNRELETGWRTFRPVLIIAPLSTLPHWADEFRRFSGRGAGEADRFAVYVLNGSRGEREARMASFLAHVVRQTAGPQAWSGGDVVEADVVSVTPVLVIPHDMLTKPLSGALRQIRRVDWHVVVIDEAQRIKSARSALFKKVCELRCLSRLVLTGTPVQNNTTELFSLLRFLAPQSFASSDLFEQLDSALLAASRSSALEDRELHILLCRRVHRLLMPFILRREKSILKTALPPMRDYAVLCPLLPFQRAQLAEVEAKAQAGALSGNPHIQFRKILLHPYTTQSFFYVNEEVVRTSGKLLVLDFMMRFLQRTRHKFLVFCGWTLVLDVVETLCGMREIPYVRLDGRTPVEQREANIRGFNRPMAGADAWDERATPESRGTAAERESAARPRRSSRRLDAAASASSPSAAAAAAPASTFTPSSGAKPLPADVGGSAGDDEEAAPAAPAPCCFLISKVAGGVGLNLQAADTVFLLDVDYNPQRDAQALSRVYRVGQTKEVRVFRLVIDHPIERDIVAIHEAKDSLGRAIVQAGRYDLHSSVQEREAALQQVFRAGTLSQLSQQWTSASAAGEEAGVGTENGKGGEWGAEAEEDEENTAATREPAKQEREDEDGARVPSPSPAFPNLSSAATSYFPLTKLLPSDPHGGAEAGDGSDDAVPAQTPTDLHRVFISHPGGVLPVLPVATTRPAESEAADAVGGAPFQPQQHPPPPPQAFSSSSSTSLCLSATTTVSGELGAGGEEGDQQQHRGGGGTSSSSSTTGIAPQRRRRRHISFKLEDGDPVEGQNGKTAATEKMNGGSVPGRASPPPPRADEDDVMPRTPFSPRALQPAEHLLAMRERLEEVLLRQDGERRVLDEMFRAVQASLRSSAAPV